MLKSSTGQILQTYTERPLELGRIKSKKRLFDKTVKYQIEYNDAVYTFKIPVSFEYYIRDLSGNLYVGIKTGPGENMYHRVYKFDKAGKELGYLDMPADDIYVAPATVPPQPVPEITVNAEYGQPVIAPNGDIYTWKRTQTNYSILKWTWQDNP